MKGWEDHVTVHAPVDQVFAFVSDFNNHGQWSGHGLQVTKVGDGPAGVGTKFDTVAKQYGTQKEQSTITHLDPPRTFGWNSTGSLGTIHHQFKLIGDEAGHGTHLSKRVEMTEPSFLAKVMGFKLKGDVAKGIQADLAKIKAIMEKQ